ncbi:MAG TPA: subclass B3 metallo-beta-lactamase [Bryobacteraceae bacterium]|nr:subclass B3 metallo-beta-lactamase [Bryobacteraceae bacterium]
MPRNGLSLFAAFFVLSSAALEAQPARVAVPKETLAPVLTPWEMAPPRTRDENNSAFPPHHVIGNVYYVGTADYASFLITSDQGHILINPDFEDSVPLIQKSVEQLGFKFQDIKIILISHAHGDHCAGTARAKELTGAQVMVMDRDAEVIEKGGAGRGGFPAVKVSRVLHDHDEVKLGGNTLVAVLTPGHTKGCTTWTLKTQDGGRTYDVVIVGSAGVNDAHYLVNNANYPDVIEDYQRTFRTLRALPCDVFLASHGGFYGLREKYPKLAQGGPNPFIDPDGYKTHVKLMERAFYYKLDWAIRQN